VNVKKLKKKLCNSKFSQFRIDFE